MGLLDSLMAGNTLYYPGCLTKFALPEIGKNYEELLRKCGVEFIKLSDLEVCCGSPVINAGYEELSKELAEKNLKLFKDHSIKRIVTSCPGCYSVFANEYPELLGK